MATRSRSLLAVPLLLVLGFATTLAIAYGVAVFSPIIRPARFVPMPPARGPQLRLSHPTSHPNWGWFVNPHRGLGHTCMVFRRAQIDSPAGQRAPFASPDIALPFWSSIPARGMRVDDHAFGLPLRCLRAVQHHSQDAADFRIINGWSASRGEIWLPRRFLWPAITANTLIFAAAWWVVLVAPGTMRRARRRRRGLCATCAYDLRGTPGGSPCPECGSRVAPV